jgi:hypothetical protein
LVELIVSILLDHGVVINDVSEAVFRDAVVENGDDRFGIEEANEFANFCSFPEEAIWTILSRSIGERLSVNMQIEGGWYIGLGDGEHGCIGSTVCTVTAADTLGGGGALEVVFVDRLRRNRIGGQQDSSL